MCEQGDRLKNTLSFLIDILRVISMRFWPVVFTDTSIVPRAVPGTQQLL